MFKEFLSLATAPYVMPSMFRSQFPRIRQSRKPPAVSVNARGQGGLYFAAEVRNVGSRPFGFRWPRLGQDVPHVAEQLEVASNAGKRVTETRTVDGGLI